MIFKVPLVCAFYHKNKLGDLRCYLISRLLYNAFVVCPALIILKIVTKSYIPSYFISIALLVIFELMIGCIYIRYFYTKSINEIFEDIPGIKIQETESPNNFIFHLNVREAGTYIRSEIGDS